MNLKITADLVNEQNETFFLNLTRTINTHFFNALGSTTAEVVVIDDCKCKVFFCFFKREEAGSMKKPKIKTGHRDGSKHQTHTKVHDLIPISYSLCTLFAVTMHTFVFSQ